MPEQALTVGKLATAAQGNARATSVALATNAEPYRCVLSDQPMFLVPERLIPASPAADSGSPLVVNPSCWYSWRGKPPADVAAAAKLLGAANVHDIVWVRDQHSGSVFPYWLGEELRTILENTAPGDPLPNAIEHRPLRLLRSSAIAFAPDESVRRREAWTASMAAARTQFEKGYAPLAGLIPAFHLGEMRRYFRRRIRTGAFPLGDDQSVLRHIAYNEPVARFFHQQLAGLMSQVAGEPVKPSYCYFASYQGGAVLEKHTDREQCEFSITFCVDYTPEPEAQTEWPIHLDTPRGVVTVYQAIGDALFYRGCRVPHYRKRLRRDATSSSIFFHYVRESFAGSLD